MAARAVSHRRDLTAHGQQRAARISPALANALLWDVILQTGIARINGFAVVRFKGRHYLIDKPKGANRVENPWPERGAHCKLLARPGDPLGDMAITDDGVVTRWSADPGRRWERKRMIVGVQDDVEPVVALPVARADQATGTLRPGVPGAGAGAHDEQLQRPIRRRLHGRHQSELHPQTGA